MVDFAKLAGKLKEAGVDQSKVQEGGGDYTPPAAGPCRLRLVSYIELGMHMGEYQGKPKKNNKVVLVFEVSGPKHPAAVLDDGTKVPHRIKVTENLSMSEKARFSKLFAALNWEGKSTHCVELVGKPFKGTIVHRTYKRRDGKEGVAAELYDKARGTWTIEPPRYEVVDPESGPTGEFATLKVDPAIGPLKAFVWDLADKEQWDSIFIEGEYPERKDDKGVVVAPAKSKNEFQLAIMSAVNFKGSPIHEVLLTAGAKLDIPDAERHVPDDAEADDPPFDPDPPAKATQPTAPARQPAAGKKPVGKSADLNAMDDDIPY